MVTNNNDALTGLIAAGADCSCIDGNNSAIHVAITQHKAQALAILLKTMADNNQRHVNEGTGFIAYLVLAIKINFLIGVELLLEYGARIDSNVLIAAASSDIEVFKRILQTKKDIDINALHTSRWLELRQEYTRHATLLYYAVLESQVANVEFLLKEKNANPNLYAVNLYLYQGEI